MEHDSPRDRRVDARNGLTRGSGFKRQIGHPLRLRKKDKLCADSSIKILDNSDNSKMHAEPSHSHFSFILAPGNESSLQEISESEIGELSRQKKPHQKSRKGCVSCKQRRVKCDEKTPECSHCLRRHVKCEYPTRSPSSSPASQSQAPAETPDEALSPFVNLLQMKLFHHFSTVTSQTLAFHEVWKDVLTMALDCEHLMHSILCLAARHLSQLLPEDPSYHTAAITHLTQASRRFRSALSEPFTESNIDALMGTGTLLYYESWTNIDFVDQSLHAGAVQLDFSQDHLFTFGPGMSQIFMNAIPFLSRKPSRFFDGVHHQPREKLRQFLLSFHIDYTQYLPFFAQCFENPLSSDALELPLLPKGTGVPSGDLPSCWRDFDAATEDSRVAYMAVAARLSIILAFIPDAPDDWDPDLLLDLCRIFYSFPLLCPPRFVRMLRDGDPRALLLMFHFYRAANVLLPKDQSWWIVRRAETLGPMLRRALIQLREGR